MFPGGTEDPTGAADRRCAAPPRSSRSTGSGAGALDEVALGLLDGHARHCLSGHRSGPTDLDEQVAELVRAVGRLLRR